MTRLAEAGGEPLEPELGGHQGDEVAEEVQVHSDGARQQKDDTEELAGVPGKMTSRFKTPFL
jgi:hypothetical protein